MLTSRPSRSASRESWAEYQGIELSRKAQKPLSKAEVDDVSIIVDTGRDVCSCGPGEMCRLCALYETGHGTHPMSLPNPHRLLPQVSSLDPTDGTCGQFVIN